MSLLSEYIHKHITKRLAERAKSPSTSKEELIKMQHNTIATNHGVYGKMAKSSSALVDSTVKHSKCHVNKERIVAIMLTPK